MAEWFRSIKSGGGGDSEQAIDAIVFFCGGVAVLHADAPHCPAPVEPCPPAPPPAAPPPPPAPACPAPAGARARAPFAMTTPCRAGPARGAAALQVARSPAACNCRSGHGPPCAPAGSRTKLNMLNAAQAMMLPTIVSAPFNRGGCSNLVHRPMYVDDRRMMSTWRAVHVEIRRRVSSRIERRHRDSG